MTITVNGVYYPNATMHASIGKNQDGIAHVSLAVFTNEPPSELPPPPSYGADVPPPGWEPGSGPSELQMELLGTPDLTHPSDK